MAAMSSDRWAIRSDERVPHMHGGLPIIGFSTLIYGAVGLTALARHAIKRRNVKPGRRRP
jgi:hypothetical protein